MEYQMLPQGSNMNIHRLSGMAPAACPAHCHDFFEIYFNLGEDVQYLIANQNYVIGKYDFAFVACNVIHHTHYRPNSRIDRVNLYIGKEMFQRYLSKESASLLHPLFDSRRIMLPNEAGHRFEKIFSQEILPLVNQSKAQTLRAEIKTMDVLLELAQMLEDGSAASGEQEDGSSNRHIKNIIGLIEEKYMERLTLDDVASRLYLNRYYVSHLFSRATGLSLSDYILMRRMREARQLLVYSSYSITEVALAVGYSNSNHFSKCFKQETGYTPRDYRDKFSPREGLY